MVKLNIVRASNAALVASQPIVAVFVGVAGIAGFALKSLAQTHGSTGTGLRAYIVGRSPTKVQPLIDECQKLCPPGKFIFVQTADLALLKDVDAACAEITRLETKESGGRTPRIDILVMGQAIFDAFSGAKRRETTEGLDTFMSLLHYSRMRFTVQLLPLLLASPLPAHVVSIFASNRDKSLIEDDLSLRDPNNYGFISSGSHAAYLKTFFMEDLAAKHPGKLSLVHYFPGLVFTDAFKAPEVPTWIRLTLKYGWWLIGCSFVENVESGDRVLFNASTKRFPAKSVDAKKEDVAESSDGVVGGGAYKVDWNNEQMKTNTKYVELRSKGWYDRAVNHTLKAFEDIESGRAFTE